MFTYSFNLRLLQFKTNLLNTGLSKQAGLVQKKNSTFNNNLVISSKEELESSSSGSSYDSSECTKFGNANSSKRLLYILNNLICWFKTSNLY